MTAGAAAVARAAGKPWEVLAEELVYRPLGMTSTSSRYDDFVARPNRAHLHVPVAGRWVAGPVRDADPQAPAGGVSSSARDLAQWVRLQLGSGVFEGEQVVRGGALAETHRPQIVSGVHPVTANPTFYGLGWQSYDDGEGRLRLGHAGAFSAGARTLVDLIPSEDLGIVVLSNVFPTGVPEAVSDTFFDLVYAGESTQDWLGAWNSFYNAYDAGAAARAAQYARPPASPSAALPNAGYVGTYTNDYLSDLEVTDEDGVLTLLLGPQQLAIPLTHYDRDLFLYYNAPKTPRSTAFMIGTDQRATQVVIDELSGAGQGTFTRVSATEKAP